VRMSFKGPDGLADALNYGRRGALMEFSPFHSLRKCRSIHMNCCGDFN
jgi:hypothetical protein